MHAIRIGKLFGIDIRVDWSWVFIFILMSWNLSSVFVGWHPDWPKPESIGVALTASVLFFGCILLHELAHSLMARRFGVAVRSITLFLFGGVSNIEREPGSAKAEFFTAVVGPITSIVLGLGFLVAGAAVAASPIDTVPAWTWFAQLGPLATLLVWLGPINLMIGIFNLIPAFPLDGGRILRSILWGAGGDLQRSTRRVSLLGQAFGWLFVITGIGMVFGLHVPFFGTGLVSGLWLSFIGWFLRNAASQTYARLAFDDALAGHVVSEVMRRDPPVVSPDLPLTALVHDHFIRSDERAVIVMRDGDLLGVVSVSDVRRVPPSDWPATSVASVMQPWATVATAAPEDPLKSAFDQLARGNIDQLLVLEGGRLVGVLQRRDLARWLELVSGMTGGTGAPGSQAPSGSIRVSHVSGPGAFSGGARPHAL
jgi:Zn-dependent protease/CBS domain-containing protein